jgi:hypothetical protein
MSLFWVRFEPPTSNTMTCVPRLQPPAGAQVDAQLRDAIAHRLNISHQTAFQAFDPGHDHAAYRLILQTNAFHPTTGAAQRSSVY